LSDAALRDASFSPPEDASEPDPPPPPPKACGSLAHGQTESRERYPLPVVSDFTACVAEPQTRGCDDGTLGDWSGSAQETSCQVSLFGVCNASVGCVEGECVTSKTMLFKSQCLADNGTSCSDDTECVNTCIDGTCADFASSGETCDADNDCDALACVGALSGASCESQICACPNGAFCGNNDECQGTCAGLRCTTPNTDCDFGDDDDCTGGASCVAGRCVLPDGSACTLNADCEHTCRDQICTARSGFLELCDDSDDCTTGLDCSEAPDTAGSCLRAPGALCTASEECTTLNCACINSNCQFKLCTEA
jgi:hypothetical protein